MSQIGIALFGLGRIGKIHLDILSTRRAVKVVYIVEHENYLEAAKKWLDEEQYDYKLHNENCSKNVPILIPSSLAETVYNDCNVQAVYVCTPTNLHEDIVVSSLTAKKAVFCEKPLSQTVKSTIKMYQLAEKFELPLLCAFNRRFDPQLVEQADLISKGVLGDLFVIKTVARDNPRPSDDYLKISGGIFHDCAVHDLDLVRFMNQKSEISSVFVSASAYCPNIKAMGDVDTVIIVLEFENGVIASIDLSRHGGYGYDQRCEVFGKLGMLSSENQRDSWMQHSVGRDLPEEGFTGKGTVLAPVQYTFRQRYEKAYSEELTHFIELIKGKNSVQPRIISSDTIFAHILADACHESHDKGVKVDFKEYVRNYTKKELGVELSVEQIKQDLSSVSISE